MNVTVLGAGAWGTTLAIILAKNGHQVSLWEFDRSYAKTMQRKRENKLYLPGIDLPDEITVINKLDEASQKKQMLVLAVPSQFARGIISKIDYNDLKDTAIVSVSKGIENKTHLTMSQMLLSVHPKLSNELIATLSGPSHAEEVSRNIPTTVTAASVNKDTASFVQAMFMTSYFRVYTSSDIIGVELGGSLKNVIAIGAGILDGIGYGDNTKAALMTRGVAEISRLGIAMGAKPETFAGLSGMGDLIVTCMSKHSRNRYVGEKIGSGMNLKQVLKTMTAVAEGVETSRSASELAVKFKVEVPIVTEVYKILFEDKDPIKATMDLMTRNRKDESY